MLATKLDRNVVLIIVTLFFGNLAITTHRASRIYMYQQVLCSNYYAVQSPPKMTSDEHENWCKVPGIQSSLSIFDGIDSFLVLLAGEVFHTAPMLSEFSDIFTNTPLQPFLPWASTKTFYQFWVSGDCFL